MAFHTIYKPSRHLTAEDLLAHGVPGEVVESSFTPLLSNGRHLTADSIEDQDIDPNSIVNMRRRGQFWYFETGPLNLYYKFPYWYVVDYDLDMNGRLGNNHIVDALEETCRMINEDW